MALGSAVHDLLADAFDEAGILIKYKDPKTKQIVSKIKKCFI